MIFFMLKHVTLHVPTVPTIPCDSWELQVVRGGWTLLWQDTPIHLHSYNMLHHITPCYAMAILGGQLYLIIVSKSAQANCKLKNAHKSA